MDCTALRVLLVSSAALIAGCGDDGSGADAGGSGSESSAGSTGSASVGADSTSAGSAGSTSTAGDSGSAPTGGADETGTGDSSAGTTGTTGTGGEESGGSDESGTTSGGSVTPECDVDVVCTGDTVWSRQFGNTDNASSNEGITAVATDGAGFSYITGTVTGMVDFEPHGIIEGPHAAFVAKVDASGTVVWAQELGAETALEVRDIDIDDDGNATIAGSVRGDLDAGDGPLDGDGSNWDVYVASYDADGGLRFADVFGSAGNMDVLADVAVHPDGNVAVTGRFSATMNFGGNQLNATGGSDDIFVAVFDPSGEHVWSRRYGDASSQLGDGITFDGDANVIVAARNYATVDFGGMPHTTDGSWAIALAKLDAQSGERVWSRQFDNAEGVWVGHPRVEADDDAIYLGTYSSSANLNRIDWGFGPEEAFFFLVKFDQSGDAQWSRPFASLRGVHDIEPDRGGSVVVVGDLQGTADFGGTELTSYLNSYDAFVAKYDVDDGAMHWARVVGDSNQQSNIQRGAGVGVDDEGFVYVGGSFYGAINFGDGERTASNGFGGSDGYLARLEP